ncbi:MAG: phospholipase [Muribaculaceae bacterium]|nr:phospholipase [Muribaculaceae bacterium]
MKGALIILAVTIIIGIILYILDRRQVKSGAFPEANGDQAESKDASSAGRVASSNSGEEESGACCGLHLVCEKELTAIADNKILYYDDEELDRFAGRTPDDYNAEETEEFRDVLMTLLPHDVPGWARSLDRRHIQPPQEIRDELLIMLQELT